MTASSRVGWAWQVRARSSDEPPNSIATAASAIIVPVVIDGSWELMRYRMKPVPFGVRVTCRVLPPVDQGAFPPKELVGVVEGRIRAALAEIRLSA